jgi:hypothetical protein
LDLLYLAGFCYTFNRRFNLPLIIENLIFHAAKTIPVSQYEISLAEDCGNQICFCLIPLSIKIYIKYLFSRRLMKQKLILSTYLLHFDKVALTSCIQAFILILPLRFCL